MVGKYVINFGIFGVVREVKADGSWILENPRIGKWIADPAKCTDYEMFHVKPESVFRGILGSSMSEREIERILQEEPDEAKVLEALNRFGKEVGV